MKESYDAIIVGAGIIGLSIGWRARQLGLSVLIVDRDRAAGAASHIAAGMLAPITEVEFAEERLLPLNLESGRRYPAFLAELSEASETPVSLFGAGTMLVALDRDQREALRRLYEFLQSLSLEVEWLGYSESRGRESSLHPSASTAIFAEADKGVDPREVTSALITALGKAGGDVREHSEVVAILHPNGRATGVRLAAGEEIAAGRVVLAAGCWSGLIEGVPREVSDTVRPVKGQIVRLRPRPEEPPILEHVIRTEEVYIVPRSTGEVVIGATVEEQGFDTTVTAGGVFELLRAADEAVPGIRELELFEASAGLRPGSRDNAPLLGPTSIDGLIAATGHYRNGILLAPVTGDSIATLLAKDEVPEEIVPFSPERFVR